MKSATDLILQDKTAFLDFFKTKFPLIHLSNIFHRDIHYSALYFLASKGVRVGYGEAEEIARSVIAALTADGTLRRLDDRTYMVNNPAYALPRAGKAQ